MAAPRKRSSHYTKPPEEVADTAQLEEFLDVAATEMFETISYKEEEVEEKTEPVAPFVVQEIVPTDNVVRFVEPAVESAPTQQEKPQIIEKKAPKRHPRNVPKFSRLK
jgi:hypothetical protein